MKRWAWNDAWILTATVFAFESRGATLTGILGTADLINHAIPTAGQLSRAFSRLAACGLLKSRNKRYLVPSAYRKPIREAVEARGGPFDLPPDKCLKWLRSTGLEPVDSTMIAVTESEARAAYQAYLERLKRRPREDETS